MYILILNIKIKPMSKLINCKGLGKCLHLPLTIYKLGITLVSRLIIDLGQNVSILNSWLYQNLEIERKRTRNRTAAQNTLMLVGLYLIYLIFKYLQIQKTRVVVELPGWFQPRSPSLQSERWREPHSGEGWQRRNSHSTQSTADIT